MITTDTHVYFYTSKLSNFAKTRFKCPFAGIDFDTTERAFMWRKAKFFGDNEIAKRLEEWGLSGYQAKDLGRSVSNYNDFTWNFVRFQHMFEVNLLKYQQDKELRKLLLDTGERILVEASPIDKIWGVGLDEKDPLILDEKNWRGQNLLGKALMQVRECIK